MDDDAEATVGRRSLLSGITRRTVLASGTAVVAMAGAGPFTDGAEAALPTPSSQVTLPVRLMINGQERLLNLDPWVTLLDALRERLGLFGTKKGCDHGQCGACTMLVDGRRVLSCLMLAATQEGREITTIEGLEGADGTLHPVQEAFAAHGGFQCGYCTPGQIMSVVGLQREGIPAGDEDIREAMSGNICRCGAYNNIAAAIRDVRDNVRGGGAA